MQHFSRILLRITAIFTAFTLAAQPALAANLIRDAEIETYLRRFSEPIFVAADLTPSAVKIFLIDDSSVNAFVAGGSNIFIHTGLILATKNPAMLIGAIAHETGHISGGHLARGTEKLQNAQIGAILSFVLGAAAAAGGGGQAGAAILSAGQQTVIRNILAFSRANEDAADQAGMTFLDKSNISANGMLELFEVLRKQEGRQFGTPDPYVLTHPLSKERIVHVRNHVAISLIPKDTVPPEFIAPYERLVAKLYGYSKPPASTLQKYPLSDHSIPARYARAVAYYRQPDVEKALAEVNSLVKEKPKDPYFHELKGQILFENSRVEEALKSYQTAVALKPDAPLIRADLGKVQLAVNPPRLDEAVRNLETATQQEDTNSSAWRLLAIAYGKKGDLGMSHLALAEEASLHGEPDVIQYQVEYALKTLPPGSPARLRAGDLKSLAEKMKKDREK